MPYFRDSRIVNYTAEQMYDLVMDIEKYPEFVPWCNNCTILSREENYIIAELEASFGIFRKSYLSKINHGLKDSNYYVHIEKISNQLKKLDTKWEFKKENELSSLVNFEIDFELESIIANNLISSIFHNTTKTIIEAFENRARRIYGHN